MLQRVLDIHQPVVVSVIHSVVVCQGSNICARDASRITLIPNAASVIGQNLETFESVGGRRPLSKLMPIMDNPSQPFHHSPRGPRSSFSSSYTLQHTQM